jgi:hypothetical protein
MSGLEDNIMEKRFSFSIKDMKWVISTLVIAIGWVITIVFWVQDKNKQKNRIETLETKNVTLERQVATLQGQIEGVNQATKVFMEYPPSESRFRIELLEKRVDKIENINGVQVDKTIESTPAPIKRNIR